MLIDPPYYRLYHNSYSHSEFSLSLAYLAGAILDKTDWEVKVYNADFSISDKKKKVSFLTGKGFDSFKANLNNLDNPVWVQVEKNIQKINPNVIGITTVSSNYKSACNVARIARKLNNDVKIIMGGPYATSAKKEIMSNRDIDISVTGEGERTIVEILKHIENNSSLQNVDGVIFRKGDQIIENKRRNFIQNLDELPFAHVTAKKVLIDYELYPIKAFRNIMTSRGCPFDCLFCASKVTWTQDVRYRSVQNVISEIHSLTKLGIKRFRFIDDTFGYNKRYYSELLIQLKEKCRGISWTCLTRADIISDQLLNLMKAAGCLTIQMGIESGNDNILKSMKKNITVDQVLNSCKLIKKHKIRLHTFFMVGFPNDTEKTLNDTVKMMKQCRSDNIVYSIFTPYPFTELFKFCKQNGLIKEEVDPTLFNHQSPYNCFSLHIHPKRFRKLTRKIEKMVDNYNMIKKIESIILLKRIVKI